MSVGGPSVNMIMSDSSFPLLYKNVNIFSCVNFSTVKVLGVLHVKKIISKFTVLYQFKELLFAFEMQHSI